MLVLFVFSLSLFDWIVARGFTGGGKLAGGYLKQISDDVGSYAHILHYKVFSTECLLCFKF